MPLPREVSILSVSTGAPVDAVAPMRGRTPRGALALTPDPTPAPRSPAQGGRAQPRALVRLPGAPCTHGTRADGDRPPLDDRPRGPRRARDRRGTGRPCSTS